jgi:hypothetical protein
MKCLRLSDGCSSIADRLFLLLTVTFLLFSALDQNVLFWSQGHWGSMDNDTSQSG